MAKKIGAIVSLSIIGILILATIIMANVNVNHGIKCAKPASIYVSYNSGTERDAKSHADAIVDYINNASKEKSLTALFNKTLNKKANINATSGVKTIPSNSDFYVRFCYDGPQKLMDGKKEYKDVNGNVVYYTNLVFELKNIEGNGVFNVYVIPDANQPKVYSYYYELEADLSGLYDYLVDNNFNI